MHLELAHYARAQTDSGIVALASRDGALLAWLAIEGPTSRARLAALLWPQSNPAAARNSLRQRLHHLRRQLGVELVVASGSNLLALADGIAHDLADSDSVLSDMPDDIGGEFAAWLDQQRLRRHGRVRESLVELSEMAEQAQDFGQALEVAPAGHRVAWTGQSSQQYAVVPGKVVRQSDGRYCRNYVAEVRTSAGWQKQPAVACRRADGVWVQAR